MTRKTAFFEGWSWFKSNNLGLALGTSLKFYTSVAKRSKLKVRKFWGLVSTFLEVAGEKLVGGDFLPPPPHPSSWMGLRKGVLTCKARPETLIKKRLWHRCFPVNFAEFLRKSFLQNASWRLLLKYELLLILAHFSV